MLNVTNLDVAVNGDMILNELNLQVQAGEVHAITVSYTHLTLPTKA